MAAENQDTVYNSKQLSKWFAISSLILLVITVWALLEDYDRPWKSYQRQAKAIAAAVGESRLKQAQASMDKSKLAGLEKDLAAIQNEENEMVGEIDGKIKQFNDDYLNKNRKFQDLKGELSADLFQLEKAIEHEDPKARRMKADYDVKAKKVEQLQVLADEAEGKFNKAKDMRVDILARQTKLLERKDKATKEVKLLRKQVADNEADVGNIIRNAPLVDFVAHHFRVADDRAQPGTGEETTLDIDQVSMIEIRFDPPALERRCAVQALVQPDPVHAVAGAINVAAKQAFV